MDSIWFSEDRKIGRLPHFDGQVMLMCRRRDFRSGFAIAGITVFAALFGIYTRPVGMLAAVWPANAILLGILVVRPNLPVISSYIGAISGYMAADLVSGGNLVTTSLLTAANVAGVAIGHALYQRVTEADRRLQQPHSVLYLLLISVAASTAAGLFGAIANPIIFNKGAFIGFSFWFATELANYIAILPVVLSLPAMSLSNIFGWRLRRKHISKSKQQHFKTFLPAFAFGLSGILAGIIGGPGSVALPLPALLWCALSYEIWTTTILTLIFSLWILLLISMNLVTPFLDIHSQSALLSIRLGVAFVAIGPLMVASVTAARNNLLVQLKRLASHDHLTNVLNRGAFQEYAQDRIKEEEKQGRSVAALMLDIDKFKSVNDTYGHAAGDQVLSTLADLIRISLRDTDLIGRLGGEEFGVLLIDCPRDQVLAIAERIRSTVERCAIELSVGKSISMTVSIGASLANGVPTTFNALFLAADSALYRAKQEGRNCTREG